MTRRNRTHVLRRMLTTAAAAAAGVLVASVPAAAEIAPAPAQLASVSGGSPVGGVLAEYAPGMSDDGRLICFVHTIPSGFGVTCATRGAGTWGAQPWGTFTGAQNGQIGVAHGGGAVAIMSEAGALNICTGSLTFGCRVVPFALGGAAPNSGSTKIVGISADGRYVVAVTAATNVFANDTNGDPDLVRIDTATGAAVPMNLTPAGVISDTGATGGAISRNGRYVAIVSQDVLVSGQAFTTVKQVYLKDVNTGNVRQASVTISGANANDWSGYPVVSDNGRYVGFSSYATNLSSVDDNKEHDLFLRDLDLGRTQRVNIGPSGEELAAGIGDRWTEPRWMSGDGRVVAFATSDLVYGGPPPQGGNSSNALRQVVVNNVGTGVIRVASTSPAGVLGDGDSAGIALSANGKFVSFVSAAANLRSGAPGIGVYFRNMENSVPVAGMSLTGGGPAPAVVNVNASGSSDADGTLVGYRWDFGDGATATGATASHTYTAPGTYRVRLVVTDDDGSEGATEQQVTVGNPVIRLDRATSSISWKLGSSRGKLRVTVNSSVAIGARFTLVRPGRRIDLGTARITAGRTQVTFTVPRNVLPGAYRLEVRPTGSASAITAGTVGVPAPVQGIVDLVRVTTSINGAPRGGVVPAGSRNAYVKFRVLVKPKGGGAIQASWSGPGRTWKVPAATPDGGPGRFRFAVEAVGRQLPSGTYICSLKAGGKTLTTVKFIVP